MRSRTLSASDFATAFAISVLPHPGGPVEQHALGGLELVLVEQLRVEERQLHGVADGVDLALETADVLVADVGDLLQDELLDLLLGQQLGGHVGASVEQHVVADARRGVQQGAGDVRDVLLVAAADHDHAVLAEAVLDLHDLAGAIGLQDLDHVQRLVQHDLDAGDGTGARRGRGRASRASCGPP